MKDAGELARMARAAAIADAALGEVLPLLGRRPRRRRGGARPRHAMRRLGAEDRAFETIVASGPNAAKPHARPIEARHRRRATRWSSTSAPSSTATAPT